jgi:hypothetical protein
MLHLEVITKSFLKLKDNQGLKELQSTTKEKKELQRITKYNQGENRIIKIKNGHSY